MSAVSSGSVRGSGILRPDGDRPGRGAIRFVVASAILVALAPAGNARAAGTGPAPSASLAPPTTADSRLWLDALEGASFPPGTRLVESPAGVSADAAEAGLRKAGYEIAVSIPPTLHVVRATRRAVALPAGFLLRSPATAPGSAPAPGKAPAAADPTPFDPFGGVGDALPPVASGAALGSGRDPLAASPAPPLPSGLLYGTRWEDTSEYMVGRVGIGIFFPESDGSLDLNRYDWTPALRDSVVRSAVRGLAGWSEFAAARGIPLSFSLEIHPSLPTRYEPITRPVSQEELWIEDMLRPLVGYRGDAVAMSYEVANGVRARLGTHWAGLMMAVQNDSSSTGTFPDGLIAHARLGGPWFVIPVNNLRTTSASLDFYVRHEVTHLFWALDEYPANNAWWSCGYATGYFNRPNWNSDVPIPGYCEPHVDCLMRGNWPNALCRRTADQVGWVDLDQSGTPDLYETRPIVMPESTVYRTVVGVPLALRGRAGESALPNLNPFRSFSGDSITVSVIDSIFYRVDGGPWISLPAVDGVFDEGEENFDVTLAPLPNGKHTIEWQASNSNGRSAAANGVTSVTVSGTAGAVDPAGAGTPGPLALAVGPNPGRGPVRFAVSGVRGAEARIRLWSATGALVREWRLAPGNGDAACLWDGRTRSGERAPSGIYFATLDADGGRLRRKLVYLR